MRGAVYARRQRGATEYYDLRIDLYQLHNALGPSDTAYPPPALATRDYYEWRLGELYGCRVDGPLGAGKPRTPRSCLRQASVPKTSLWLIHRTTLKECTSKLRLCSYPAY